MNKQKKLIIFIIFCIITIISSYFLYNEVKTTPVFNVENGKKLPIIMYHQITKRKSTLGKFAITPEQFEEDIKYLKENGFNSITMEELLSHVYDKTPLPENPIMITFDDGFESFYEYAYPVLKKYNFKAVMSIVGSFTEQFSKNEDHNINYSYLTWSQVNELQNSGYVEIQNHTYNLHKEENGRKGVEKKKKESLEDYKALLKEDLLKLQEEILSYTGYKPSTIAYPFGKYSKETKDIIKELGFKAAFTCAEKLNNISYDTDWLYYLGRFNRPHNISTYKFFKMVLNS